jgi:peptidyl-dipeptidase A
MENIMLKKIAIAGISLSLLLMMRLVAGGQDKPAASQPARSAAEMEFAAVADAYLAKFKPLTLKAEQAWWEANITGSDEAFKRRQDAVNAMVDLHSDHDTFAKLKAFKEQGKITDPLLSRTLEVMYLAYLPGQADKDLQKKVVELETKVEQTFNTYRSSVDGKSLTENDVRQVLSETKDPAMAEKTWKGYMAVGDKVAAVLRELVAVRNQLAKELGFKSYFSMQVSLQQIDEKELWRIFDDLHEQTREPYKAVKKEIDGEMAARFGVAEADLHPWHYCELFFQEPPGLAGDKLTEAYKDKDLTALAKAYYASMGLPVDDILARSDLYEKPGKCPHAFAADLDRAGDTRVLANLKPTVYWADTILHELGHAVYDKYIGQDVPFVLHTASHSLTTEGVALMMGAMAKNEEWLVQAMKLSPQQAAELCQSANNRLRTEKLIFSCWAQVVVRFERAMYENPDQDLNKLWWDLKKQYQLLNPPDDLKRADYAAKIHIVTVPVYYHNYVLGDLFAAQVQHYIGTNIVRAPDPTTASFYGRKEVGDYLCRQIFAPGNLLAWNELTKQATGETLSAKYFVQQFVQERKGREAGAQKPPK